MNRCVLYIALIILSFIDKLPPPLSERAAGYRVLWDSKHRIPLVVLGGGFYFEPCSEKNPVHQKLFEHIFMDPSTTKFWAVGEVRTKEEAYNALKRYASPWESKQLTGGFVVMQNGQAVMLIGVGLFQAEGVGEFYIMADSSVRGKGLATEVMKTFHEWCLFLNDSKISSFINYTNGKKAPLDTVFATASEENVPSIRLMLKCGFHPIQSLHRYRYGFPKDAQLFTAPSSIKGLKDGNLSMIYPTRYMKRKAGFILKIRDLKNKLWPY